jgi:hypothetical protein
MPRTAKRLAIIAILSITASAAHAECRTVAGSADMITRDLAKFMAEAALKNAIADKGMKPAGPINMQCRDDTVTTYCKATRQACR